MYQNIMQMLQQLFSGSNGRPGMQPGGGISDMMYRMPRQQSPSFIDGLLTAGGGPTVGLDSVQPDGSTQFIPGERPGTYGVEPGAPPMGGELPPMGSGATSISHQPSSPGMNLIGGNPAPGGERPGTYGVNPGAMPGYRNIPPRLQGRPGIGGAPSGGSVGFAPTGPINPPGMGRSPGERPGTYGRPMPMPRPPSAATPAPMPGATTRPVTGFKPRVTGGY